MMMTSDEEKRWLVVGLAMTKVVAPALRDVVEQGMNLHYKNLAAYCNHLPAPCNLNTLTFSQASADSILKSLKFENINKNSQTHGKTKKNYNCNVSSPVDLAKLYLPDYLAAFSAFDESLDLSAVLRLLGWSRPVSIFPTLFLSPDPLHPIQSAADDVRDHIRNKWAHANFSEWSEAFSNDCFTKLGGLIKSVGLGAKEKDTLDQLSYWQTKGCQIVMGHAVDQQLLDLVLQSLKLFRKEFEALQETVKEHEQELNKQALQVKEHQQRLDKMSTQQSEQAKQVGALAQKHEDLERSIDNYQQRLDEQAQQVDELQQRLQEMSAQQTEQARRVDEALVQLHEDNYNRMLELLGSFRVQPWPESLLERPFDLKTFRAKLSDRYIRTATVQTSVWSAKSKVDIRKVFTRLSMKKDEQSVPVVYTELFMNTNEGLAPKRILVEGQAGIGKSTFVTKLCLDWAEGGKESVSEESNVLKKFELVLTIKLRDVSHCQTLKDVIRCSDLLPEEDKHLTDALFHYITESQHKVLFVFDGYDEYGKANDSEVYDVFKMDNLRDCCVLLTSRCSQADDVREFADVQAEVTGFNTEDIKKYLAKQLGEPEAQDLWKHLEKQRLTDTAKVPLLALFYSVLWNKGKAKFIAKARTMVFKEIVQCILDYGNSKCTPPQFKKVEDSKDILVELGKVALDALLNDDLLFEYGKLKKIKCELGVIRGFFQITEETKEVRPTEKVSFIHKTIQEFLAALYIHYQCVPEGCLGPFKDQANSLEKCLLLDNVFQFVSGLSDDGAMMIIDHFKRIKRLDPALDLSKTIVLPETARQTCYDVVGRQKRFHDLVFASFEEAKSKERLLKHCTICTSGVILLSEQLARALLEVADVAREVNSGVIILNTGYGCQLFNGEHVEQFLDRLDVMMKVNERSHAIRLGDFLKELFNTGFGRLRCICGFRGIVLLSESKMNFYITDLILGCPGHERWFCWYEELYQFTRSPAGLSEIRSSIGEDNSLLVESCLKYLQTIECRQTDSKTILQQLGAIADNSKYLSCLNMSLNNDHICDFLEQIKETHLCTLKLSTKSLTTTGAQNLARLLPRFNISKLSLKMRSCTSAAVSSLVTAFSQNSFNCKILCLKNVDLTAEAAKVLGDSISKMSELEVLVIKGKNTDFDALHMQALFGCIHRELPLRVLELSCFRVQKAGLLSLRGSLKSFSKLQSLQLNNMGMDAEDVCYLLNDVSFPELWNLDFSENHLRDGISSIKKHIFRLPNLSQLVLYNSGCSKEEINFMREAFKKVNVCT